MYIINKNYVITMNRGDTLCMPISLYIGKFPKEKLSIDKDDIIYFALMEHNQPFECSTIKQEYTIDDFDSEGNLVLQLDPLETMGLYPGKYYYSLKLLKHSDSSITTLIPKTVFYLVD